jgi:hypothetical protein
MFKAKEGGNVFIKSTIRLLEEEEILEVEFQVRNILLFINCSMKSVSGSWVFAKMGKPLRSCPPNRQKKDPTPRKFSVYQYDMVIKEKGAKKKRKT